MSACIIPIAPEFQDPPSDPEGGPHLYNPQPQNFNSVVSVINANPQSFRASVMDADTGTVTIYYRWIFDYPPDVPGVTHIAVDGMLAPMMGPINVQIPSQLVDCQHVGAVMSEHRLELVVANQQFSSSTDLNPTNDLDSIDDPTGIDRGSWTIQIACPATTTQGSQ